MWGKDLQSLPLERQSLHTPRPLVDEGPFRQAQQKPPIFLGDFFPPRCRAREGGPGRPSSHMRSMLRSPGAWGRNWGQRRCIGAVVLAACLYICDGTGAGAGAVPVLRLSGGGRGLVGSNRSEKRKIGKHCSVPPTEEGRAPWRKKRRIQLASYPQAGEMALNPDGCGHYTQ